MAGTTAKGIAYPTTGDLIDNLHSVFTTLASSVDTVLNGYVTTASIALEADVVAGTSTTKVISPKALADANVYTGDTGWTDIAASVTAGSGWTKGGSFLCRARRVGNIVQIRMTGLTKAASPTLSVSVTGNIANSLLVSGVPAQFRPAEDVASLASGGGGRANAYYLNASGSLYLAAVTPAANQTGTVNLPTNEEVSCGGMFFGA